MDFVFPVGRLFRVLALMLPAALLPALPVSADEPETIIFGGDAAYPPFEWLEDGRPVGFNIELEDALAELGNARAEHRLGSWPDIMRALEAGEVDIVPMFRTEKREQDFAFSSTYFYVHHSVYARPQTPGLHSIAGLRDRKVAVEELSYAHERLSGTNVGANMVLEGNTLAALHAVAEGRADYAVLAVLAADELIHRHGLNVQRVGSPIWPREYGFAVRGDRPELIEWLRTNLALAVATGKYEEIYHKWEDRLRGQRDTLLGSMRDVAIVLVPLLLLATIALAWSWALRRKVADRTRALEEELRRRSAAEEALRYAAEHDGLTGLPELHHFVHLLDQRLEGVAADEPVEREVMVIELVELGRISRTFGADLADDFVRAFAERIRSAGYPVIGYLGRGAFAIYSDSAPTHSNFDALTDAIAVRNVELHPNIVAGSALWPQHGESAADLVRHAETAMAASESARQMWMCYEPGMEPDPVDLQLVSDFRKHGSEELSAVFQPQLSLETGKIVGAEALVRWNHRTLGFVSPARFIPLLEQTGLVARVTEWMVREAAEVAARLHERGDRLAISINVSAQDLLDESLIVLIKRELERWGLHARQFKIELTETSVAEDPERVREALRELSRLGVRIAVDDFGTGYSSLSYLGSFPIDEVKIDREFVDGMTTSPRKQSIVRSTIALAQELGMTTVAEGAEDEATVDVLRNLGCHVVQGYVISRPLAVADLFTFVRPA